MQNIDQKRDKRIQQIKDCGQAISDYAESIYGNYAFQASLTIKIEMPCNGVPTITVDRTFYADKVIEHL